MTLTSRQTQTLQLLATGLRQKQVADHMGVTEQTVEAYLRDARKANKMRTTVQLVASAARQGLI